MTTRSNVEAPSKILRWPQGGKRYVLRGILSSAVRIWRWVYGGMVVIGRDTQPVKLGSRGTDGCTLSASSAVGIIDHWCTPRVSV